MLNCAVIADRTLPRLAAVAALAESRLAAATNVVVLDREHVQSLLGERELARLLSPDAVAARADAGRLLKAELLVLLSAPADGGAECVVSDTRRGIRLGRHNVPLAGDAEAAAGVVARAVRDASERIDGLRRTGLPVVAVPPFVSNDLLYENDYLRDAYARLAESSVMRAGGVTVELREAEALATEAALAGDADPVRRELPVYLLGEFRTENAARQRIAVTVRCVRGNQTLWTEHGTLDAVDVPAFIGRVGERAANNATAVAPDPAAEAAQLAARADTAARLGEHDEAIDLLEAALLLTPDDAALHREAMTAYGKQAGRIFHTEGERTVEQVRAGSAAYFRGLDHFESFLARTEAKAVNGYKFSEKYEFWYLFFHSASWTTWGHPSDEVLAALDAGRRKSNDRLQRMAEWRARSGNNDDARLFAAGTRGLNQDQVLDLAIDAIVRLKDLPGFATRARDYCSGGSGWTQNLVTPAGQRYIDRVAAIDHPDAPKIADELRRWTTQAADAQRKAIEQINDGLKPVVPPAGEVSTYRPVTFDVVGGGTALADFLVPAEEGVDVVLFGPRVLLMKNKGLLTPVWACADVDFRPQSLCFDGRYAWATFTRNKHPALLLRIDPQDGTVVTVGKADGLPRPDADTFDDPAHAQSYALTAVAAGPGRVLLVGSFGRTFLATASTAADGGVSVRVFHEAREQARSDDTTQWKRTTVAFLPRGIACLEQRSTPDGKPATRLLVSRDAVNSGIIDHPLVVDLESNAVTVLETPLYIGPSDTFAVKDGTLYFARPQNTWHDHLFTTSAAVMQFRLGDDKPSVACREVYPSAGRCEQFPVAFDGDRFLLAAQRIYSAASPGGPFAAVGSTLPFPATGVALPPTLLKSNHYGLLVRTQTLGLFEMQNAAPAERP